MLKFRATNKEGRPFVGLGLSFTNLARLQQDKPIFIKGEELGIDHDILIFAGETEQAMAGDLKRAGITWPGQEETHGQ